MVIYCEASDRCDAFKRVLIEAEDDSALKAANTRVISHSLGRHVGNAHEEVSDYGAVLPCLVYYVAFMLSKRSCTAQIESIIYF